MRIGGKEFGVERYFSLCIYLIGGDWCFVNIFKIFLVWRLLDMMKLDFLFYLVVVKSLKIEVWYKW